MAPTSDGLELALQPDAARLTGPRFLEDVVVRHGDRLALCEAVGPDGAGRTLTYDALYAASRTCARGLIGAGVGKGTRVALWLPNGIDWVVASFAVGMAGGVLVPINTYATASERDYILRHSDAAVLITQTRLLEHRFLDTLAADHPEIADGTPGRIRCPALPHLRRVIGLDLDAARGALEPRAILDALGGDVSDSLLDAAIAEVTPSDDGVVIYTSGTTAHPKGVLHLHRAPVIQSWRFAELMALVSDDVILSAQPFFWTAGIAMSLGASLAAGAKLIVEPVFTPERFIALIERERVTALHAWPHQEKAMADHPEARTRDLSSLEKIEFASPLAPMAGLEKDQWGTYGSYGLSETFTLAAALPASAPAGQRRETSGRPLPGTQIRIVDPDTGVGLEVPDARGEIAVRGATLMRGYYKVAPELYLDPDGWFHTQDGGAFDADGSLHWSGRLSNLIKTGGANVSPLEIERALSDWEGVSIAHAVGVPHPVLGEAIVLCVVPAPGARLEEDALRARLREQLAAYKVPRRVLFFAREELAFTANQKVQVGPLRDRALTRLAEEAAEIDGVRYGG